MITFREPTRELPELRAACALAYQVVVWSVFNGPGDLKAGEVRAYIRALFGPRVDAALDSYIDEYAKNIPPEPPKPGPTDTECANILHYSALACANHIDQKDDVPLEEQFAMVRRWFAAVTARIEQERGK